MSNDILIQQPPAGHHGTPELVLLFHGVGSSASALQPLGAHIASLKPHAWVITVSSPHPSDVGRGWQWFSVQGITEAHRPERIAAAMPAFLHAIARWQAHTGVEPGNTTLVGFSQGAIMLLESAQQVPPPAQRFVSIAGRFAQTPHVANPGLSIHLLHGTQDAVVAADHSVQARAALDSLGTPVTLDLIQGLGHQIDKPLLQRLKERLA